MDFIHITDTHFRMTSNVRTDVDYRKNLFDKLRWVCEYANKHSARLLIAGDLFDTPSVPDQIKSELIQILSTLNQKPVIIYGNHDTLFANSENNYKTSLNLVGISKVATILDGNSVTFNEGNESVIVTNKKPMTDHGIPQIGLFHGFLNKEDGKNTFLFTDIQTDDKSAVLLGHDHVPYDMVPYKNSKIFRIGAMVRGIRNDSELRNPQLLHLRLNEGEFKYKYVDIPCVDPALIFKTKKVKAEKLENNYQSLIEQLKNTATEELTLIKAVRMVSQESTAVYVKSVLEDITNKREAK